MRKSEVRAAASRRSDQSDRKRNFVVLIVGAVFNRDCPGKSRLPRLKSSGMQAKAAPTSFHVQPPEK
jgi:hypothetical protein